MKGRASENDSPGIPYESEAPESSACVWTATVSLPKDQGEAHHSPSLGKPWSDAA
jgi:hypothetical protein